MQPLQYTAGVVGPAPGAATGLGGWFLGVVVLPVCGDFQRRRQHSATTAHRALPVGRWPALGIPRGTARSHAGSAVCSRCAGACTGGCGWTGQVVCGGCGFAGLWRFSEEEAALGNHSKCVSCHPWACHGALQGQMQPLQCAAVVKRLALGLRQGRASGLCGLWFCR